jgi:hypothetical protein
MALNTYRLESFPRDRYDPSVTLARRGPSSASDFSGALRQRVAVLLSRRIFLKPSRTVRAVDCQSKAVSTEAFLTGSVIP